MHLLIVKQCVYFWAEAMVTIYYDLKHKIYLSVRDLHIPNIAQKFHSKTRIDNN